MFFDRVTEEWGEQEADTSRYMLEVEAKTVATVENRFSERVDRGGWAAVPADRQRQMPGHHRGLVFVVRPRQGPGGTAFYEIRSERYMDRPLYEELFEGIPLHDHREFEPIQAPELALDLFCIPASYARTFAERVISTGGRVRQQQGNFSSVEKAFQRIRDIHAELSSMHQSSMRIISQLAEGVHSDAPLVSQNTVRSQVLLAEAQEQVRAIRDERLSLHRGNAPLEQKALAEQYEIKSGEWIAEIEHLHRLMHGLEAQAISRVGETLSKAIPGAETPAIQRQFIMDPVCTHYVERGVDVRMVDGGMQFFLEDGRVIEMTDRVRIHDPNDRPVASSDALLAKPQGRGQRDL
jgi:hypothetical protein